MTQHSSYTKLMGLANSEAPKNGNLVYPRRACAARVPACLSVCLSVTALAATAFVSTCNERHLRQYYRLFLDFNSWIFKSYGVKKK